VTTFAQIKFNWLDHPDDRPPIAALIAAAPLKEETKQRINKNIHAEKITIRI